MSKRGFVVVTAESLFQELLQSPRDKRNVMKPGKCCNSECKNAADTSHWCSRCRSVCYCDEKCQRADWTAAHKKECQPFTLLHAVVREDSAGCCELLEKDPKAVSLQIKLDEEGKKTRPIIHYVAATGNALLWDIFRWEFKADINEKDWEGLTAEQVLKDFERTRQVNLMPD